MKPPLPKVKPATHEEYLKAPRGERFIKDMYEAGVLRRFYYVAVGAGKKRA